MVCCGISERLEQIHFDPKVLDAFGNISRDLYDRYSGHEGEDLKAELTAVVGGYYSAGMETLSYGSQEEQDSILEDE